MKDLQIVIIKTILAPNLIVKRFDVIMLRKSSDMEISQLSLYAYAHIKMINNYWMRFSVKSRKTKFNNVSLYVEVRVLLITLASLLLLTCPSSQHPYLQFF